MNRISYYLPEKQLKIDVPYTVTETTQKYSDGSIQSQLSCEVLESILIEEVIVASQAIYQFDTDSVKGGFSDIDLTLKFDVGGKGILTGVNLTSTPFTGKLLKASIGVAVQIAKFAGVASGMATLTDTAITPVGSPEVLIQEFKVQTLIDFSMEKVILPIPSIKGLKEGDVPKVILSFSGIPKASVKKPGTKLLNGICIREGLQIGLKVLIENNGLVKKHVALDEVMYVPQLGDEKWLTMKSRNSWFTKRGRGISIHQDTGRLTEYTIKRENQLSEILTSGAEGVDSFRDTLQELRKEKETGALKSKKEVLELQKQILEAEKKIKELKSGN